MNRNYVTLGTCTYLAHDVRVVIGDESKAPGPASLFVVHNHRIFHLAEPIQQTRTDTDVRRTQNVVWVLPCLCRP